MHKKAVRIITQSNYIAHSEPLRKQYGLIRLTDMFSLAMWKFNYKLMSNQLPTYFSPEENGCTRNNNNNNNNNHLY